MQRHACTLVLGEQRFAEPLEEREDRRDVTAALVPKALGNQHRGRERLGQFLGRDGGQG